MIIVTGGAGFIGSSLIWRLNQEGRGDIVVADRMGNGAKWRNLAKRQVLRAVHKDDLFSWLEAEAENGETIDAVFHMGASSSTVETDVDYLVKNNLNYSVALWKYCTKHQIPFVYASSASTYGDGDAGFDDANAGTMKLVPMNPYGFSKHKFDAFALAQKAAPPFWAGLKFFNVYGPNEYHKGNQSSVIAQFFPQVQATGKIKLFASHRNDIADGEQKRDFVYVKDCVDVMWHLYKHASTAKSGVYNVGTGTARTFKDLALAVFDAMDVPAHIEVVPMPESLRGHYQYFTEAKMDRLRQQTGYDKPPTPLEAGVKDYVSNYLLKNDPYL